MKRTAMAEQKYGNEKPVLRVLCWSGGADSTAACINGHISPNDTNRIDLIVFSEVMFDRNYFGNGVGISGELPEQIRFIYAAKQVFESWGYNVAIISDPERDYMWEFNHIIQRSADNQGYSAGFPLAKKCSIQRDLKVACARKFLAELRKDYNVIEVLGYTAEETERILGMRKRNGIHAGYRETAPLADAGITHKAAIALCEQYNLLSPIYKYVDPSLPDRKIRSGCWFCPWAKVSEMAQFKMESCCGSEVFQKFIELENREDIAYRNWNYKTHESLKERNEKVVQFIEDYM